MAGPSVTSLIRTGLRYFYRAENLADFSGGLNLLDAPTELAANESPDLWNVTLDERGGVVKRLGMTRWNAAASANAITYGYYSQVCDKLLWYSKADGILASDPGTGVLTTRRTWTVGSRISIVDFAGKVYAVHPVDGLYSSTDGATWAAVTAASGTVPKGDVLSSFQNKLWVAGDTAQVNRVYFCAAGDPTKWASVDGGGSNDVREKDDTAIVALYGAGGFDQQGRPSLLVGKSESLYRVYDSSTGAYVTLDGAVGPASAKCLVSRYGNVYVLSRNGVYRTTGFTPCMPVSEKLAPLFTDQSLAYSKTENFCAGAQGDRLYFSVARSGQTVNDLALEHHPLQGWFTARSDAAAAYVSYNKSADTLLGASPTATGRVYKLNNGGSDDGVAVQSWFLTRPFQPNNTYTARLQQTRTQARGIFTLSVLADFATAGQQRVVAITLPGFQWDVDGWDDPTVGWGDLLSEQSDVWAPGTLGRTFQFRLDETSSISATAAKLLETGSQAQIGAWALYGIFCNFTPLGFS